MRLNLPLPASLLPLWPSSRPETLELRGMPVSTQSWTLTGWRDGRKLVMYGGSRLELENDARWMKSAGYRGRSIRRVR